MMDICTAQRTFPPNTNTHTCWKSGKHLADPRDSHECVCGRRWIEDKTEHGSKCRFLSHHDRCTC